MRNKEITLKEKPIIARYLITTTSGIKKKWKRIMIEGENTIYEMNRKGILRYRDTKEIIEHRSLTGYEVYNLIVGNKRLLLSRHRLLASLFIPIPKWYRNNGYNQEHLMINHKDGIKGHDVLDNLEWVTPKENVDHAIEHGLIDYLGENSYLSTITDEEALRICELLAEGKRPKEVSEITGISEKIVRHIYHGESWKQLSKDYEFPEYEGPKPYMYSNDTIKDACDLIQEGKLNNREISEVVGINERYISDLKTNKRRVDISSEYDFSNVPARNAPKAIVARQVCELLQEGKKSVKEISEITGMNQSMVSGVKNGRYWTTISKDYKFDNIPYDRHTDDEKINRIRRTCELLQERNMSQEDISKEVGISRAMVEDISRGKSWKSISKDYDFPDMRKPAEIDENIHKACLLFTDGVSDNAISKEIGISRGFLRKLRRREIRTDISNKYNF